MPYTSRSHLPDFLRGLWRTIECMRRTMAAASKPRPWRSSAPGIVVTAKKLAVSLTRRAARRPPRAPGRAIGGAAAAQGAGQGHRERGVGVEEGRRERAADHVGRQQRLRDALVARALADEV